MEVAIVEQRGQVQDGGCCHGVEKTGKGWRRPSQGRGDGHGTEEFIVGKKGDVVL